MEEPAPAPHRAADLPRPATATMVPNAPSPSLDSMMARPLFTRGRRAAPPAEPVMAAAPGLPRLTGVLVNGSDRSAILVPAAGGPAMVVREGAAVGGFTVRLIKPGEVTVSAPDGERVLRLSYDRRRAAAPQAVAAVATTVPAASAFPETPAMGPPIGFAR